MDFEIGDDGQKYLVSLVSPARKDDRRQLPIRWADRQKRLASQGFRLDSLNAIGQLEDLRAPYSKSRQRPWRLWPRKTECIE